jgi:hypothetical protein
MVWDTTHFFCRPRAAGGRPRAGLEVEEKLVTSTRRLEGTAAIRPCVLPLASMCLVEAQGSSGPR